MFSEFHLDEIQLLYCPTCQTFVPIPGDASPRNWSSILPTDHRLIRLMDAKKTKSKRRICAACARKNEVIDAYSWCVNCQEQLCNECHHSHSVNKASLHHKLIEIDENFSDDIQQQSIEMNCKEHPTEEIKLFCITHDMSCCVICVREIHGNCEKVHIDKYAERLKNSEDLKKLSEGLYAMKLSFESLHKDKSENKRKLKADIEHIRSDVEKLFEQITHRMSELVANFRSEVSNIEMEFGQEIKEEQDEFNLLIDEIENLRSPLQTSKSQASPCQFIQTIKILSEEKKKLEKYLKEKLRAFTEIRVSFKTNQTITKMSESISVGKVDVHRILKNDVNILRHPNTRRTPGTPEALTAPVRPVQPFQRSSLLLDDIEKKGTCQNSSSFENVTSGQVSLQSLDSSYFENEETYTKQT